jgi:hypothetical protein
MIILPTCQFQLAVAKLSRGGLRVLFQAKWYGSDRSFSQTGRNRDNVKLLSSVPTGAAVGENGESPVQNSFGKMI